MEIKFKTSLCNFRKGEKPCYLAHVIMDDRVTWDDVVARVAETVGVRESVVKFVADELVQVLKSNLAESNRVSIEGMCDASKKGLNKYGPTAGIMPLRDGVAKL